jgi:hypothetical protein
MSEVMAVSRADLHRRMAEGYADGYRNGVNRGYFTNGGEWAYADDALFTCGPFGLADEDELAEIQVGKLLKDINEGGQGPELDSEETSNVELKVWWQVLPDYQLVDHRYFVDDDSFIMWSVFTGTAHDGTTIKLHEVDYVETNEAGQITRWDALLGYRGWDQMVRILTGKSVDEFSLMDYLQVIMTRAASLES